MKRTLTLLIGLAIGLSAMGQITVATNFNVEAPLPVDTRDTIGTLASRDAIPDLKRYEGMTVYVYEDSSNYQLVGGIDNSDWKPIVDVDEFDDAYLRKDGDTATGEMAFLGDVRVSDTIFLRNQEEVNKYYKLTINENGEWSFLDDDDEYYRMNVGRLYLNGHDLTDVNKASGDTANFTTYLNVTDADSADHADTAYHSMTSGVADSALVADTAYHSMTSGVADSAEVSEYSHQSRNNFVVNDTLYVADSRIWHKAATEIGDSYGGGLYAGYGYIVSTVKGNLDWSPDEQVTNATSSTDGRANTDSIVDQHGSGDYAAYYCDTITEGGYSDWYLPAKNTLDSILCDNGEEIGVSPINEYYWSSTEADVEEVYTVYYGSTICVIDAPVDKVTLTNVRTICIREEDAAEPELHIESDVSIDSNDIIDVDSITANRFVGVADSAADAGALQGISNTSNLATDTLYHAGVLTPYLNATYAEIDKSVHDSILLDTDEWTISVDASDTLSISNKTYGGDVLQLLPNGTAKLSNVRLLDSIAIVDSINNNSGGGSSDSSWVNVEVQQVKWDTTTYTGTGTINLDMTYAIHFIEIGAGNITLDYSSAEIGTYIFHIKQDATGGRTVGYSSGEWQSANGSITIDVDANDITILTGFYNGQKMIITETTNLEDL